jgi:ABC-2 type transport system ATP-binding protein
MDDVIVTKSISKNFGKVKAVDNVSLNVRKGEIYGFLGLNGAGKTTTIRMLLGMINPSAGEAFINGEKTGAGNHKLLEKIGSLVEIPYAYPELTVTENLAITAKLKGLEGDRALRGIMEKLRLTEYAGRPAGKLSLGNAQRLGIAKAMLGSPEILILDEPANGLDPAGIVEIRELLKSLANDGATIFISSHILNEISRIATRIGIIHKGALIQETDNEKLDQLRRKTLTIRTANPEKAAAVLHKAGYESVLLPGIYLISEDEKAIKHPEKVAEALVKGGCPPSMLKVDEEDLETYFLRLVGAETGAEAVAEPGAEGGAA